MCQPKVPDLFEKKYVVPAREREIDDQKISLAFSPPVPNIWALLKNTQRKELTCQGKKELMSKLGRSIRIVLIF